MGRFNPDKPSIIGMEFVPIAGNLRAMDIGTEIGYGFSVTGAPHNTISSVQPRPFISASRMAGQTLFYSVYPRGREDDTGDINVVRLTVSTAFVTGAVVSGSSAAACLQTASDNSYIEFDALADRLRTTFTSPIDLTGKRILGVDLVYQAAGSPGFALEPSIESNTVIYPYGPFITGPPTLSQAVAELGVVRFGEVNPWFSTAAGPNASSDRGNWRYTDMLRWLTGAGGQLFIGIRPSTIPLSGTVRLGYLAVDVYYCEESRVACGGTAYGQDPAGLLTMSALTVSPPVRDALTQATPVTLTPGDYTITATLADAGDKYNAGDKLLLPQVFQLDQLSTHPTIQVEKFKRPVAGRPAVAPLSASTDYMLAAVMIDSSQALQFGQAPVPYFTSEGAPVFRTTSGNNIDAVQELHNEGIAGVDYPWVRFYARRFNPTAPGSLSILPPGGAVTDITPEEFVTYPEITLGEQGAGTGWREITRRLDDAAAFTHDSSFSTVSFSMGSVGTSQAIDQYQILTSRVFTPVNIDGKAPVSNTAAPLYQKSRYDGFQNANLTWFPPEQPFTGAALVDASSTAVVMFSTDPPAPTGLAIEQFTQPVSGIGLDCFGGVPTCIPTGIIYNHLSWGDNQVVCDTFTRSVTGDWGTSDTGQPWTVDVGDQSVDGSRGLLNLAAVNTIRRATIDGPLLNGVITAKVAPGVIAAGGPIEMAVMGRRDSGANTNYLAEVQFSNSVTASGVATLRLRRNVAGVLTTMATFVLPNYSTDSEYFVSLEMNDSFLRAKAWPADGLEPLDWQLAITDTNITAAGLVGVSANLALGNTNTLPVIVYFDDFMSTPLELADDAYTEIQRADELDEEGFQTIATLPVCVKAMDDYEARVGLESTYRIRSVNTMGFPGPWSAEVSTTLPAPGITGAGDGNSVLIFTTNQAPTGNLAYVMTWDGDVAEEFTFPEAGFGQVRTQYQRDFFTSFHGTERGGDAFSRDVLVQAAAIAPESLANFKSLRDLTWANLPYVCVRDELGNRWFASVRVPGGTVKRNRRLYNARIDILESTDTPAPVTS